jgi:hypothetical protein
MSIAADLDDYLIDVGARPFNWAAWNCCHFVSGWVQRVQGVDPMQGLAPTPSARSAWRLRDQLGVSLADAASLQLGLAPVAPAFAQVGDVVAIQHKDAQLLGICAGRHAAVLSMKGQARVNMEFATMAWRMNP